MQYVASWFERPMVSAEFAHTTLGALSAIAVAGVMACLLYALTL